jgi:NAD(P)-dependent dehydrogenase (short-subunit alcohol dehydrogenase family)
MKTIAITGANRGIGLELARQAAVRGDRVVATCRNPDTATDLQQLAAGHAAVGIHALTVDDAASVARFAQALRGTSVDVLINNAGIMGPAAAQQSLDHMDYDGWAECHAVNTMAPLRLLQALRPNLEAAKPAKAVTITSQMGAIAVDMRFSLAYCASKAAVNKVMRLVAPELATAGVIVSLVHPGWVRTDMGGSDADIAPEESASGIWKVIDRLGPNDAGSFWSWTGEPHPW